MGTTPKRAIVDGSGTAAAAREAATGEPDAEGSNCSVPSAATVKEVPPAMAEGEARISVPSATVVPPM